MNSLTAFYNATNINYNLVETNWGNSVCVLGIKIKQLPLVVTGHGI